LLSISFPAVGSYLGVFPFAGSTFPHLLLTGPKSLLPLRSPVDGQLLVFFPSFFLSPLLGRLYEATYKQPPFLTFFSSHFPKLAPGRPDGAPGLLVVEHTLLLNGRSLFLRFFSIVRGFFVPEGLGVCFGPFFFASFFWN